MSNARELSQVPNITEGFKNRIINGDMRIDQRNAGGSVTVTTDGQYTLDRFKISQSQNSKFTVQQSTVAPTGFTNSLLVTVASAVTPSGSDYFGLLQPIEGFNVADLGFGTANAQTVTLSFWVRSSLTGTFSGMLYNNAANRSYCFTYTINAANTMEYKTITIVGDTSGTWTTNNTTGLGVYWDLGSGTNTGTAGSWQGTIVRRTSSSVQLIATSGATFYITGVQLEVGSVATEFDRLPYGTQLSLCQRYYQRQFPIRGGGVCNGTASLSRVKGPLVVTMRASPTAALVGTVDIYDGVVVTTSTSIGNTWMTPDLLECDLNLASALTAGRPGIIYNSTAQNGGTLSTGGITLSAEL
jgi:hypothetical protein